MGWKIGDWEYIIGEHSAVFVRVFGEHFTQFINLTCEDCLHDLGTFPDHQVDMVLADPPYQATRNKWDIPLPMDKLWKELYRVCKKNAVIALHSGGMFTAKLMTSNPKDWRYNLVWHKTTPTGFLNAKKMPLRAHEDICIFYRKTPVTYHPQKTADHSPVHSFTKHTSDGTNYGKTRIGISGGGSTERYPTSVLTFATDKQRGAYHSTQKPVKLEEWLIKTYTDPGDVVLDFCMGSGSTGVAALNTGRSFFGIELDEGYYQIATSRIKEAIEESAEREVDTDAG